MGESELPGECRWDAAAEALAAAADLYGRLERLGALLAVRGVLAADELGWVRSPGEWPTPSGLGRGDGGGSDG